MQVDPYHKEFTNIQPLEAFFQNETKEEIEEKLIKLEEEGKIVVRGGKDELQALQDDLRKQG